MVVNSVKGSYRDDSFAVRRDFIIVEEYLDVGVSRQSRRPREDGYGSE
jgi:hypothetical protein